MILVCNAIMMDINHPNEYIRGSSLRFLCKLKEPELLAPLIPSIKANLTHRHSYVRRHAVLAVFSIYNNVNPDLMPDAPEIIEELLMSESDHATRKNAFMMLFNCDQDRAINFLRERMEDAARYGEGFQLVILELTRKVVRDDPSKKAILVPALVNMLTSEAPAVSYEAAWTLCSLSSAPTAIRASANAYVALLTTHGDNNVKLIVLERLSALKKLHSKVLSEMLMDIMRALACPNADIRKATLDIALALVTPRNIGEVVSLLKKEVVQSQGEEARKEEVDYRGMLIKAIHTCAVRFPEVASSVVHLLMDFLGGDGALHVILLVREMVQTNQELRASVLDKLVISLPEIKQAAVYRVALWILGEYAQAQGDVGDMDVLQQTYTAVMECLGDPPFVPTVQDTERKEEAAAPCAPSAPVIKNVVLADGTYATQSVYSEALSPDSGGSDGSPLLRRLIMEGDFFLAGVVSGTLTKMVTRMADVSGWDAHATKRAQVDTMLVMCSLIQMGRSNIPKRKIGLDALGRITFWLRLLSDPTLPQHARLLQSMFEVSGDVLADLLQLKHKMAQEELEEKKEKGPLAQPDSLISFRQLRARNMLGGASVDLDDSMDINKATADSQRGGGDLISRLNRVYPLTGMADPVYVEAVVTVHDYDIVMDMLVINRTPNTITNMALELATTGELKLVERPSSHTIGPLDSRRITATIKVSSTETGHIFGQIVYDSSVSAATTTVNLNNIQIDIMDYIQPAKCSEAEFRTMWADFEWENKVAVNTSITEVGEFLNHIIELTHMNLLTTGSRDLDTDCAFLAANLYAKSIFGEDALMNVSVEKTEEGRVVGYIRIRSKTQGIALSLGERVTSGQKQRLPKETM